MFSHCFDVTYMFVYDNVWFCLHVYCFLLLECNSMYYIDGLVQERRNSSALAMEFRLSCTNPLIYVPYRIRTKIVCNFY